VKILSSIREEVTKKFESSKYFNKIEEIFDDNLENALKYFIECSENASKSIFIRTLLTTKFYLIFAF